jgi:Na+-transporting NADH:ubiquinone oxidoreductase subunit D
MTQTCKNCEVCLAPLHRNNPITGQILGICSSLAVTNSLRTAAVMALSVTFVTAFSSFFISLLRTWIPTRIRLIVQMTLIASLVILVDQVLRAYAFALSKQLSVFVGLIITNCIVLGRAEAFALSHPPLVSGLDGLANGLGYAWVLLTVATLRELIGSGSIFGYPLLPLSLRGGWYIPNSFFLMPAAGFFLIGTLLWVFAPQKPPRAPDSSKGAYR